MSKLQEILTAIDPQTIAEKIVLPCKVAEQTFKPRFLIPTNYQDFMQDCADYWDYMTKTYLRATDRAPIVTEYAGSMALRYINQAFQQDGGALYAFEKSKEQTFGFTKRAITEQFLREVSYGYIDWILRTLIDPNNYAELVEIMKEYANNYVGIVNEHEMHILLADYKMILKSHVQHHAEMATERKIGHRT